MLLVEKAWYEDGSMWVAALELVFSLISAWMSSRHTRELENESAHQDLRAVLQRLLTMSRESQDSKMKYKDDPEAFQTAQSTLLQEMNVLASQGATAARRLPGLIASSEYLTIARAQGEANDDKARQEFIDLACTTARTTSDMINAYVDAADFAFLKKDSETARRHLTAALARATGFPYADSAKARVSQGNLCLLLARLEAKSGGGEAEVASYLRQAETVLQTFPADESQLPLSTALVTTLGELAKVYGSVGNRDAAKRALEEGLSVLNRYSTFPPEYVASVTVQAHLQLAQIEAVDEPGAALARVQTADRFVRTLPEGDLRTALQKQVDPFMQGRGSSEQA